MMTEELSVSKTSVFAPKLHPECCFKTENAPSRYHSARYKRHITHRWCSRLAASKLPGSDLAVEYLYGKYVKNLSVSSINQSGRIILNFLGFLDRQGTTIHRLTRQDISVYVQYQQDRCLKTTTVINYLRSIYAFIVFLVDQGVLSETVMQPKIRIKLPQALPRAMPAEDRQRLLEAITTVRDKAMILLLLRTGMRIGELLEVKVSDIILVERKILIYLGEKNFQGRAVYYSEDAEWALQDWLKERNKESDYLFPGKVGRPNLSYTSAYTAMRKVLERAGLSGKGYSLHNLRHTFATDMLNAGMRLEVLQQLLGHQEIEMTMRYAKMTDLTRENEYFKAMDRIEQGDHHEPRRVNTELQKVFKEKKLHRSKRK
ncbi:MAG: tyrosine-type recombinase/integrase [Desulfobacterales bacterium]|nr:tyrosine-type recombinase/integrase [Deltaproteobacteria bacterium]NNK94493.1 tyrosine-type recombinase/integrase [Desulfobacterales bacterium]